MRFFAFLTCLFILAQTANAASGDQPNIVLIMSDDMGWSDIGCYGGEINTPNLDTLASGGLRFTQFYNVGRCCPTRASLLTGLYPHQAGVGHMTGNRELPGYTGNLHRHTPTIAEVLRLIGFRTYMAGKWHVTLHNQPESPKFNWPRQRGFDRFYGTITGAGSFYDPATLCRDNTFITPENDPHYRPAEYYYTDAISDNAVKFLQEHHQAAADKPFFLYVAYTAAHWPMHALERDIAKYRGKYDGGYSAIRDARVQRLRQLGLLSDEWDVSPQAGDWSGVKHPEWEKRCMEAYAAMVDNMDQGIGRIIEELKRQGQLDNTVVFYLQDNGGCAEGMGRQEPRQPYRHDLEPFTADQLQPKASPPMQTRGGRAVRQGPSVMPGPADTYIAYGRNWANVSNTPFREYKHWVHEGGISTPLIVHWPQGIATAHRNRFIDDPAHLIDIMATCVDLAGCEHPSQFAGQSTLPWEGISLRPTFAGEPLNRENPLFWEHEGNRAVRDEGWKLVAKSPRGDWELYDMESDRTEMHNLAEEYPQKASHLARLWDAWAERAHVKPWPWAGRGE